MSSSLVGIKNEAISSNFELLTTLRYDVSLLGAATNIPFSSKVKTCTPFYMLKYHQERLVQAAQFFAWKDAINALNDVTKFEEYLLRELSSWKGGHEGQNQEAFRVHAPGNYPRYLVDLNSRFVQRSNRTGRLARPSQA